MTDDMTTADWLSPRQFQDTRGVEDWRVVGEGAVAFFRSASFAEAARLVQAVARLPGIEERRPDVDVRPDGVTFRLVTIAPDQFGVTRRDAEAARTISTAARSLGMRADPSRIQTVTIIPGAPDTAAVIEFWRTVLGYDPRPDSPAEDLIDPRRRGPSFWVERMEEPRSDGGGAVHICVWVPSEQAEARVASSIAAGGRLVRDEFAPSWWTLMDAAGNEADIATTTARG